MFLWRKNNNEI